MRGFIALAVLLALAVGCSLNGDDAQSRATITEKELPGLVLMSRDLPRVFIQFDRGPQLRADSPGGARSDPTRFGRLQGWKSRFRRPGSPATRGPLVIESRTDLFESSRGAEQDLKAVDAPGFVEQDAPELGDNARVLSSQAGQPGSVRYVLVAWREDNALATVYVSGFQGKLSAAEVIALARKQQARLARAAVG